MTIFQPELAKLSAEERYAELLAAAAKARQLKQVTATSAPSWRLPKALRQLSIVVWRRFITALFDGNGAKQRRNLIHSQ